MAPITMVMPAPIAAARDVGVHGDVTCGGSTSGSGVRIVRSTQARTMHASTPSAARSSAMLRLDCGVHVMVTSRRAELGGSHHPLKPPLICVGGPRESPPSTRADHASL